MTVAGDGDVGTPTIGAGAVRSRNGSRPGGPDAERWLDYRDTLTARRQVLFVVHTVAAATRLRLVAPLLADDFGVQVTFTVAPDEFGRGAGRFLDDLGAVVFPWRDAVREPFDLAVAASYGELHRLRAPVVVLPHGAGHNKLVPRRVGVGLPTTRAVFGFDRERLVRNGRVVAAAVVLSHVEQLALLGEQCPEALPAAVVAGDPCYDQITTAGLPERAAYRRAMGLAEGQRLVVVTSTWGRRSLLGECPELLRLLLAELPAGTYRVAAVLHPNVLARHGRFQISQSLATCREQGLLLVPPDQDWQAALIAADWVIGDHGSVTLYATAAGVPVLIGAFAHGDVAPGSPAAELAAAVPRLRPDRPVQPQLAAAAAVPPERAARIARRITSVPGAFAGNLRRLLYRLLELEPPATMPRLPPLRPPIPGTWE